MKKYQQVYDWFKSEINSNSLKAGDKIISIREASYKFDCNKSTIIKAYSELEKDKYIYSVDRSGYYVLSNEIIEVSDILGLDFASGNPDLCSIPPKSFQQCIDKALDKYQNKLFQYACAKGLEPLVYEVKKQLEDNQIFTNEKNIVITSGSQQTIDILTKLKMPNCNNKVLVEQPVYTGVLNAARHNNVEIIGIERTYDGIDLDKLESIFRSESIKFFYIIPRFHNPLGTTLSLDVKKKILALAKKYNVMIVEDDYLADFGDSIKSPPMYYLDDDNRVIYVKTYSKVFLPGLRVGAVVLPDILVDEFIEYKRWTDLNTNVLAQGALEIYLSSNLINKQLQKTREVYVDRMNTLSEMILESDLRNHIVDYAFQPGSIIASISLDKSINFDRLIYRLEERNISLRNSKMFYLKYFNNNDFIRFTITRAHSNSIKEHIGVFNEILHDEVNRGYVRQRLLY